MVDRSSGLRPPHGGNGDWRVKLPAALPAELPAGCTDGDCSDSPAWMYVIVLKPDLPAAHAAAQALSGRGILRLHARGEFSSTHIQFNIRSVNLRLCTQQTDLTRRSQQKWVDLAHDANCSCSLGSAESPQNRNVPRYRCLRGFCIAHMCSGAPGRRLVHAAAPLMVPADTPCASWQCRPDEEVQLARKAQSRSLRLQELHS